MQVRRYLQCSSSRFYVRRCNLYHSLFYNKITDMPKQKNIDELVENEITGTAKALRKALTTVKAPASDKSKLLSSGFVPLNLASTNCHHGFIAPGEDCIIFGDSASGKTWLYLQILAEAANNPHFDEYRLIVDNSENGIGMDIERFFGTKLHSVWNRPPTTATMNPSTVRR